VLRVEFLLKTDGGYPKDTGLFFSFSVVVESFYVCFPGVFEIGRLPLKKSEIGQVVRKVVRFL